MKTVCKTSLSPKKRKGLHTRKTNIQENNLITKQTFHQTAFSMKTFYKTSPSPKNILHENGLQNKPFTKEHSPRKWSTKQTLHQKHSPRIRSTKQAFHQKKGSTKQTFHQKKSPRNRSTKQTVHQKNISKKTVYKTNLPPKKTQENGLQKRHWPQIFPKKTLNTRALAPNMRKIKPY